MATATAWVLPPLAAFSAALTACTLAMPEPDKAVEANAKAAAPEAAPLSLSAKALWDGQPGLGIWASHADITDPVRVRLTLGATGRSVIGVLVPSRAGQSGFALSSAAAGALGLEAHSPAQMTATLLLNAPPDASQPPTNTADAQFP